jgi:uncharacterized protein
MPSLRARPLRVLAVLIALIGALSAKPVLLAARVVHAEYMAMHPSPRVVDPPDDAAQLGLASVRLVSSHRDSIAAWHLPSRNGAAIVMVHGSGADRRQLLPAARAMVQHGFGVLLLDAPGSGESTGRVTFGAPERDAVRAGAAYLSTQPDVREGAIGAYGFSAGALAVLQAAAADTLLRAIVVSHCPPDLLSATRREYAGAGRLAQWSATMMLRWRGVELERDQPIVLVGRLAPRPLLILGGTDDPIVPIDELRRLASSSRPAADLVVIRGLGHTEPTGRDVAAADTVRAFLARALRVIDRSATARG